MKIDNRLQKLRSILIERDIDTIMVSQPENRHYLSGFYGSAGYLFITQTRAILATDFRYIEQAKSQSPDYEIFQITNNMDKWLPELVTELNITNLGFEAEHVTFSMHHRLSDILDKEQPQINLLPLNGIVESLRAVKEPEEIELIRKAVVISDDAFNYIKNRINNSIKESELAWDIEKYMRERGSEGIAFDIIVASGPNSALPHVQPSSRKFNDNEPIVIDIGAKAGAYCSDITRTICTGNSNSKYYDVYNTVLEAQIAAINNIKTGMTGNEADNIARQIINKAGYGNNFGHGLGHGIGLATHESPRLGPSSTDILSDGMVFTIEPGIYISGWGGIRIEDTVIMENGKTRVLSKARKILHDRKQ